MKLWIIYTKYYETNATYSPLMMKEAAFNNGINAEVYYSDYFSIVIKENREILFYKDKEIKEYPDVVFFRCYAFELMEYLNNKGIELVNSYKGMIDVRDKFKTHQIVNKLGVNQPKTIFCKYPDFNMLKRSLGLPFIMKDNSGSRGNNVYLINDEESMLEIINNTPDIKFIFQEYISVSKGKDIRLYVVGDKVIGSITRIATSDDFRANVSLGGVGKEIDVPSRLEEEAINIAKKLGLAICSVDYLYNENEYVFCEANGNAAFSAFIKLGYKMQDIFMRYIKEKYN